jgi:hypothetical protein
MKIKKFINSIIYRILFRGNTNILFHIEEIDFPMNRALIRFIGTRTLIKTTIIELIQDPKILQSLSATQACWIGGCYGRYLQNSLDQNKAFSNISLETFSLKEDKGIYRIISRDRSGEISYMHKKTKILYIKKPLDIVLNEKIINSFDPTQACYLGILAGVSLTKNHLDDVKKIRKNNDKPILKLIK